MKGCRCHCTDWTARAKQAVLLFLSLLGQFDSVIGQIGLDFLSSVSDKKNYNFRGLILKNWGDSMVSFMGHFNFLSVLSVGPIVFGNSA